MFSRIVAVSLALAAFTVVSGAHLSAQRRGLSDQPLPAGQTNDPFPEPIVRDEGVITVTLREFASLPEIDTVPARMMTLVDEPRTRRLFVSEMRGVFYTVSQDGKTVTPYLDLRDPKWAIAVQSEGRERGIQSFVLHPQFAQTGTRGFGRFYTYTDVSNQTPDPDFTTPNAKTTHDTVLIRCSCPTTHLPPSALWCTAVQGFRSSMAGCSSATCQAANCST